MNNLTFRCGVCGGLMAVGEDLRSQTVRCPHCHHAVQVPAHGVAPHATPADVGPAVSAPVEAVPPGAETIFEASAPASDLFGREVTPLAGAGGSGEASAFFHALDQQPHAPSPTSESALEPTTAPAVQEPFANLGSNGSTDAAPPSSSRNLFASDGLSPSPDASASLFADTGSSASPLAPPRTKRKLGGSVWLSAIVIPYSIAATVGIAGLLYFRGTATPERPVHPLESLLDQGLYDELAEGGKKDIIPPNSELPKDVLPLTLGVERQIGSLGITPLDVSRGQIEYAYSSGWPDPPRREEVLVLRLRLKNNSTYIFHPNDPTFNRAFRANYPPYTFLEIGEKQFYGIVKDPLTEQLQGQVFKELLPGDEMETLIVAGPERTPGHPSAVDALRSLKNEKKNEPLLWRVHLRKGREEVTVAQKKRLIWTTTVVPVSFTPYDVRDLD